jgi:hypothetical protein
VNGGFDDDVDGWVPQFGATIEHSPNDALGSPISGALAAVATVAGQLTVGALQCIPVVAGKTYVYGAAARMSEVQPGNAAFVSVDWYAQPNCSGAMIAGNGPLPTS